MGTYLEWFFLARRIFLSSGVPRKQQKTCTQETALCKAFSSAFFKNFLLPPFFRPFRRPDEPLPDLLRPYPASAFSARFGALCSAEDAFLCASFRTVFAARTSFFRPGLFSGE